MNDRLTLAAAALGALLATTAGHPARAAEPLSHDTSRDTSLDTCIQCAVTNAPEIRQAELTLDNQKINTLIQKARFAVNVKASAERAFEGESTAESLTIDKEIVGGFKLSSALALKDNDRNEDESGSVSITLSKVILGGGFIRESLLEVDNSLLDELIVLNRLSRLRRETRQKVTERYYQIIRNIQTLRAGELRLARSRKNLEHARERENPLDIATAEIDVPETEAQVFSARQTIQTSLDELKRLMGLPVSSPLAISPEFEFRIVPVDLTNDLAHCMGVDEEILNRRLAGRKLDNTIGVYRLRRWPRLTLSGKAIQGSEEDMDFKGDPEYFAGLSLSWELGRVKDTANYRLALNDRESNEVSLRALREDKEKLLRNLARRIEESRELVRLQEDRIRLSQRQMELYADRWQNGEIGILEYIRSQNDLENARIQLINQKTSYLSLLGEYRFASGR